MLICQLHPSSSQFLSSPHFHFHFQTVLAFLVNADNYAWVANCSGDSPFLALSTKPRLPFATCQLSVVSCLLSLVLLRCQPIFECLKIALNFARIDELCTLNVVAVAFN